MVYATPCGHERLPGGVGVGHRQPTARFVAAFAATAEEQDEIFGGFEVGRIFWAVVLRGEQIPFPQHDLIESSCTKSNGFAHEACGGGLNLLLILS